MLHKQINALFEKRSFLQRLMSVTRPSQDTTANRNVLTKPKASRVHAKLDIDCWRTRRTVQVGGARLLHVIPNNKWFAPRCIDINTTIVSSILYSFGELLCKIKRTVAQQESRKEGGQSGGQTGKPKGEAKGEVKAGGQGEAQWRPKGEPKGRPKEEAKWGGQGKAKRGGQ